MVFCVYGKMLSDLVLFIKKTFTRLLRWKSQPNSKLHQHHNKQHRELSKMKGEKSGKLLVVHHQQKLIYETEITKKINSRHSLKTEKMKKSFINIYKQEFSSLSLVCIHMCVCVSLVLSDRNLSQHDAAKRDCAKNTNFLLVFLEKSLRTVPNFNPSFLPSVSLETS
jgi:hypothetical protein